jgi:hypothetical protein
VVDEHVTQLLHRFNIPTGRDLEELHAKLAALNAQLDELTAISSTTDEGTSLPSTGEPRS